ncbi:amidohydrolase family protein [Steroidobacter sp. S1-65]|uniref:Amidohydrolase family protein n=1 Tax=Steroidobacter gossypii TaxID=2805490 RepID=A0ABS1WYH1_9GAMM|nr:amidohydrolase family protein [Steroidobacter gossypii]MBM0106018.1 amidohydrolase family protein [Steroidobacter gossypii]
MILRILHGLLFLSLSAVALAEDRVFDVHVHIWEGDRSVKEYLGQVASAGRQVTGFGGIHMAVLGKLEHTRAKNDDLIALARRYPQLMPIASVHPYDGEAAFAELARLDGLGVKAIKLHPHTQKFDAADERVLAICRRAGELGLVVLMDNANVLPGDNQKLFNLALAAPKTHFVFTHMGALEFRFWNILPLARTAKGLLENNIHFDISATSVLAADSPLEEEFVWTMRNVGIDNLVLGSDFPQLSLEQAVDALERLPLTEEERRKIRWQNASRIFSLEDAAGSSKATAR